MMSDIVAKTSMFTVKHLIEHLEGGSKLIEFNQITVPIFQRKEGQWDLVQKSNFIERILYSNVPITSSILLGSIKKRDDLILIDGLQRLSTLRDFTENKFSISSQENDSDVVYTDLSQSLKGKILSYQLNVITLCNLDSEERALEIFREVNSGKALTEFQKTKGSKELSSFCGFVDNSQSVERVLRNLGFLSKNKSLKSINLYDKVNELITSVVCLSENPTLFRATASYSSQWKRYKPNIDSLVIKYIDENYWNKLANFLEGNFNSIANQLSEKESKIMFLFVLLSVGPAKWVNISTELQNLLNSNSFKYIQKTSFDGKFSASGSRQDLFKNIQEIIKNLKTSSTRRFSVKDKNKVLLQQNNKCSSCKNNIPDISFAHGDHIKPYSKGGKTTIDNLTVLCETCNKAKGNAEVEFV